MKRIYLFIILSNSLFLFASENNPILELLSRTYHTSLKGDYLYSSTTAGLTVYHLKENNPTQISYLVVENSGASSIIDEDYLYLFAGNSGIYQIDIKNRDKPAIIKNEKITGSAINGDIKNENLFVSLGSVGFGVLNKNNLKVIKVVETPSYCSFVKIIDSSLIVSTENHGLIVYRTGDLKEDYRIKLKKRVRDIMQYDKDSLLIANDTDGLIILKKMGNQYKISNGYDTQDTARGVAFFNNFIFVADGNTGIVVLKLDSDETIQHVQNYKTGYSTNKVVTYKDYLIISNDAAGIMVVPLGKLIK
ncbi:MAG: hypothetical protein N2746_04640 [Deltaproteobacteria bacterium]|nr:hypothetical protein [Deltaproteobacteria bacterium]